MDAQSRHWRSADGSALPYRARSGEDAPDDDAARVAAIARVSRDAAPVRITFTVRGDVAPALRSAIQEISDTIAYRLSKACDFRYEDALTCAMSGIATLRAAICAVVPTGDERYVGR